MEEIIKRLDIVQLAIKVRDFNTVAFQCEILRKLSFDNRLDEIIDLLELQNYRQALDKIEEYNNTQEDGFFTKQDDCEKSEEIKISLEEDKVLELEDILNYSKESQVPPVKEYTPPPSFDYTLDDFLVKKENKSSKKVQEYPNLQNHIDLSDINLKNSVDNLLEDENIQQVSKEDKKEPIALKEDVEEDKSVLEQDNIDSSEEIEHIESSEPKDTIEDESTKEKSKEYPPIPYIGQKFKNMLNQFPPIENTNKTSKLVEKMKRKITFHSYTEDDIEQFLEYYYQYKDKGKIAESALVLLLSAGTESQFAQFLLARELVRGEVIEENHIEAFAILNNLADHNFPEAICDLAQLYEYGIGIKRDKQMALLLYEEASELGVERASKHYERLKNSQGLNGFIEWLKLLKPSEKASNEEKSENDNFKQEVEVGTNSSSEPSKESIEEEKEQEEEEEKISWEELSKRAIEGDSLQEEEILEESLEESPLEENISWENVSWKNLLEDSHQEDIEEDDIEEEEFKVDSFFEEEIKDSTKEEKSSEDSVDKSEKKNESKDKDKSKDEESSGIFEKINLKGILSYFGKRDSQKALSVQDFLEKDFLENSPLDKKSLKEKNSEDNNEEIGDSSKSNTQASNS